MKLKYITFLLILISVSLIAEAQKKVVILGTNDTHSRIEPLPANDKQYAGMGGVEARSAFIKQVRAENENVLLFDAGNALFQLISWAGRSRSDGYDEI